MNGAVAGIASDVAGLDAALMAPTALHRVIEVNPSTEIER